MSVPHIIVGESMVIPSATFNRPADTTAYAVGDLVANSTTAGSVVPMSWALPTNAGEVLQARIKRNDTSANTQYLRLHIYTSSPTVANGDNAAWSTTIAALVGSIDVNIERQGTDYCEGFGVPIHGYIAYSGTTTLYGLLEARNAYTPTSGETFIVELFTEPK